MQRIHREGLHSEQIRCFELCSKLRALLGHLGKHYYFHFSRIWWRALNIIDGINVLVNYRAKSCYVVEQTTFNFYKTH